ncbi:MAG: autotransporter-associated beta strand repeat-containing protein, partial [Verrucomicrobiota bacterium]
MKTGSGTLTLSGTNSFIGGLTINSGAIKLGSTGALNSTTPNSVTFGPSAPATTKLQINGNTVTIGALSTNATPGTVVVENANAAAATLTVSQTINTTFAGVIQNGSGGGALSFTKTGSGTLTLSGPNSYTGTTTISGGILAVGADANLGDGAASLNIGAGTLEVTSDISASSRGIVLTNAASAVSVDSGKTFTHSGAISGTGFPLNLTGLGTLAISGNNTFTGGVVINSGVLQLGSTTALNTTTPNSLTFGASAPAGTKLQLNGNSVTIGALSTNATPGSPVIENANASAATLTVSQTTNTTYAGVLQNGSGGGGLSLTKSGSGILTLSGANTFTGTTTISAGTLALSGGAAIADTSGVSMANTAGVTLLLNASETIGSLAGGGVTGGNVTLQSYTLTVGGDNTSQSYSGAISGAGGLTKSGTGTQTLAGINLFTGTTTVSGGTLALSGGQAITDAGAVSLDNTAGAILLLNASETIGSLAGGGTSGGNVNLQANTLTVGGDNTNTTYYGLISGTGGSLTKIGTGTLLLHSASSHTYTGSTAIQNGALQLGGGVGSLLPTGTVVTLGTASTATGGKLILGDGANGTDDQMLAGLLVASGNTGSNSVVGGNASRTSALTLNIATTNTYAGFLGGTTATENNLSLTKTGAGTLTLSGINTYTGGVTISAGTLSISAEANLGDVAGSVAIGNGTLQITSDISSSSRAISLTDAASAISISGGKVLTHSGVISGSGKLNLTGSGRMTLSGLSNTYYGGTHIQGGTLNVTAISGTPLGSDSSSNSIIVDAGANLSLSDASNKGSHQTITINSSASALGGIGISNTAVLTGAALSGMFTDSTGLFGGVLGINADYSSALNMGTFASGSWFLGSVISSTYSATSLTAGTGSTYRLGGGGGTLTLSQANVLTGSGYKVLVGSSSSNGQGTVVISNDQNYTGITTINGGTLSVGGDGRLGTGTGLGNIVINGGSLSASGSFTLASGRGIALGSSSAGTGGTLDVVSGATLSYAGIIANNGGTNSLTKTGLGTLALSGNHNTYTGGTNLNGGITSFTGISDFGASGAISFDGGTLLYASGTADITARTVTLNAGGGTIDTNGSNVTFSSAAIANGTGTGSFTKAGAGTLKLSKANTYAGNTIISAGTVQLGIASAIPSGAGKGTTTVTGKLDMNGFAQTLNLLGGAGTITNDSSSTAATLTVDTTNNASGSTFSGNITDGTSAKIINLTKSGTNTFYLTGSTSSYSGITTISGGTLNVATFGDVNTASGIGKGSSAGSSADLVINGGTLQYTGSAAASTSRLFTMGTSASLDASGSDVLSFTNAGSLGFTSTTARTLTLTGTNTGNNVLAPIIGNNTGATSLTKTGAGTWVLAGANTYTGTTTVSAGKLKAGIASVSGVSGAFGLN